MGDIKAYDPFRTARSMMPHRGISRILAIAFLITGVLWMSNFFHTGLLPSLSKSPPSEPPAPPPPPPPSQRLPSSRFHDVPEAGAVDRSPARAAPHRPPAGGAAAAAGRVAVFTFITSQPSYLYQGLKNKWAYTRRHGYELVIDYAEASPRGTMWLKFDMAERLIAAGKYDWIWWVDFDTLFTNRDIAITDVIKKALDEAEKKDDVDFILSRDCNDFNAGSILIRSSQSSLDVINQVRKYRDDLDKGDGQNVPHEQEALKQLINSDPKVKSRVHFVSQTTMNAFPKEIGCYDSENRPWEPGMLLLHFAGAWAHVQEDDPTGYLMEKYREYGDWGYDGLPNATRP